MNNVSKVRKVKEKKTYFLNGIEELSEINFREVIPKGAFNIELEYKDKSKILIVDYLIDLKTERLK